MKSLYRFTQVIIVAFFCTFPSQASSPKGSWHLGQVTLQNKVVLEGDLSYNWLAEMVMIRQADGRISTLSAEQVLQFGWFDYTQHKYRSFQSLSASITENKSRNAFFELYMDGPLAVVRRLKRPHGLFKRAFGHPANYIDQPTMAQNTEHFEYYVHDAGHLLALDRFYTDIYTPLMTAYERQLEQYVQSHNINSRTVLGRLILVDHYNFLVQKDARTASAKDYGSNPN